MTTAHRDRAPRECQVCGRKIRGPITVCHVCENRVRRHLASQTGYLEDLELELARQVRKQAENDGGRSSVRPLPFSPEAGDVIVEQRRVLTRWASTTRQLLPAAQLGPACRACQHPSCSAIRFSRGPRTATVTATAVFLDRCLPMLRKHPEGPRFVHEIQQLVNRIVKIIDSPENLTRIHVGPCPNLWPDDEGHDLPCPGEVEAIVPADEQQPAMMRCNRCEAEWDTTRWTRTGRLIQQRQQQLTEQETLARALRRSA